MRPIGVRAAALAILAAVITGCVALGGCSTGATPPTARPFPEGDPQGASRTLNPSASPIATGARASLTPGHLVIASIGVNSTVMALGTQTQRDPFLDGREVSSFEVPPDLSRVGWWSDGPRVGSGGMAVLLGHSQVGGGYAVFNRLASVRPDASVVVENAAASSVATFRVTRVVNGIPKSDATALASVLAEGAGESDLALITCGGDFDERYAESAANTVAFAKLRR